MRKKRKKSGIKFVHILWGMLLANIALGLSFSKVTSIAKARVDGVPAQDQERIQGILEAMANIPCVRVDARKIESIRLN